MKKREKEQLIMIKAAGRSVVLSFMTLIVTFFYIQPEVGEAFNLANDSQNNITNEVNNEVSNEITNDFKTEEKPAVEPKAAENTDHKISEIAAVSVENKTINTSGSVAYSATAYSLRGRTASGSGVRRGIIAADPRVLPLGTRVYLTAGQYSGTYVVADTGGAIKGRKIDIWMASHSEAIRFGRRKVSIKVLGR
jgi:3D (Asp-Asp-Asp) domain-containing protein